MGNGTYCQRDPLPDNQDDQAPPVVSTPLDPCPIEMKYEVRGAHHNHDDLPPGEMTAMEVGTWMHTGLYSYMDESSPLPRKSVRDELSRRLRLLEDKGQLKIHRMSSVRREYPNTNWIVPNMVDGNRRLSVPVFPDDTRVKVIEV